MHTTVCLNSLFSCIKRAKSFPSLLLALPCTGWCRGQIACFLIKEMRDSQFLLFCQKLCYGKAEVFFRGLRIKSERGLVKSVKQGLKESYFLKFLQFFSCEQKRIVHFVLNFILFNQHCFHLFYILSTDMPPPTHSFSVSIQKQAGLPQAWHIKLRKDRTPPSA